MKKRNLLISQLKDEKLIFIPDVNFDSIRENIDNLEKKTKYLETALEKEREANVDERYEKEITYLHKQLSYCPFRLNEEHTCIVFHYVLRKGYIRFPQENQVRAKW